MEKREQTHKMVAVCVGRDKLSSLLKLIVILFILTGCEGKNAPIAHLNLNTSYQLSELVIDPLKISVVMEYFLCEYLYSTLIEMDQNGQIKGNLAKDYGWLDNQNTIYIRLKDNLKTSTGKELTLEDVRLSLNRAIILGNTHSKLKFLLKNSEHSLQTIDEQHPDVKIIDDRIEISLKEKYFSIFNMLTSADYGILPGSVIDRNTFEIKSTLETSGPYFLETKDGRERLVANRYWHDFSEDQPQLINFVYKEKASAAFAAFEKGELDFTTTTIDYSEKDLENFVENNPKFYLHSSRPLKLRFIKITNLGLKKFKTEERKYLHKEIKRRYKTWLQNQKYHEQIDQFFPAGSEGVLSEAELSSILDEVKEVKPKEKFFIGVYEGYFTWFNSILGDMKEIELVAYTENSDLNEKFPSLHGLIRGTDTSYHEDMSLVSYNLYDGTFGLTGEEAEEFEKLYTLEQNKSIRIQMLKKLHKEGLMRMSFIPLSISPYLALAKKGLELNFPFEYPNSPVWKIRREQ